MNLYLKKCYNKTLFINNRINSVLFYISKYLAMLAFFFFLGWDIIKSIYLNKISHTTIGEHWFLFDKNTIILTQSITQRFIHHKLWDPVILSIIQIPTWSFFLIILIILHFTTRKKRKKLWFR